MIPVFIAGHDGLIVFIDQKERGYSVLFPNELAEQPDGICKPVSYTHLKGTLEKILRLVPQKMAHIGCSRHPVVGKLHHKGHGLSLKGGLFKDQCHEDPYEDPKHIKPDHHQSLVLRVKSLCKEGVDRKLGCTAHKRRQENGHLPVPVSYTHLIDTAMGAVILIDLAAELTAPAGIMESDAAVKGHPVGHRALVGIRSVRPLRPAQHPVPFLIIKGIKRCV